MKRIILIVFIILLEFAGILFFRSPTRAQTPGDACAVNGAGNPSCCCIEFIGRSCTAWATCNICNGCQSLQRTPSGTSFQCRDDNTKCSRVQTCINGICVGRDVCGDGVCSGSEGPLTCPLDCHFNPCGDGVCDTTENSSTCPQDCAPTVRCGDGVCSSTENSSTCPQDCTSCGDHICQSTETFLSCPQDCQNPCGNGTCETSESVQTCPQDCRAPTATPTSGPTCGNGACEVGENTSNCSTDCQPQCGNGTCEASESSATCPQDCGQPPTVTPTPVPNCSSTSSRPDLCVCDANVRGQCLNQCTNDTSGPGTHCCSTGKQFCPQNGQCVTDPSQCPTSGMTVVVGTTLLGIGQGSGDNRQPVHPSRSAELVVYNSQNQSVSNGTGTLVFDGTKYNGNILLASTVPGGAYYITVRMDNTLRKQTPGILNLTSGTTATAPTLSLITGDLNQDNTLNLADYNIFLTCFGTNACSQKQLADLNDDGLVEEIDLNILQRNLATRRGDGPPEPSSLSPTPLLTNSPSTTAAPTSTPTPCSRGRCDTPVLTPTNTPIITGNRSRP